MMDFLECKVCKIHYDEEKHRPRNAPCGHELCSICLSKLIKVNIFECPNCRQKHNVNALDDLPVSFGLLDVIRGIKAIQNPLTNDIQSIVAENKDNEICKVHHESITFRCVSCQLWICSDCKDCHSILTGCKTVNLYNAMMEMKRENTQIVNKQLAMFDDDADYIWSKIKEHSNKIEELTNKRKQLLEKANKHENEITGLQILIELGKDQKKKLEDSQKQLNESNSPYSLSDKIEVMTHMKQALYSWSVKHVGIHTSLGLPKALKEEKKVYAMKLIGRVQKHAKLSHHQENIHFHSFRETTLPDACSDVPFAILKKMIPTEPSLIFLELSCEDLQGHVIISLDKSLPNVRKNIVDTVTGQELWQDDRSLIGIRVTAYQQDSIKIQSLPIPFYGINPGKKQSPIAKQGDILGYFDGGCFQDFYLYFNTPSKSNDFCSSYGSQEGYFVFGHINEGLETLKKLHNKIKHNYSQGNISECGLVIRPE